MKRGVGLAVLAILLMTVLVPFAWAQVPGQTPGEEIDDLTPGLGQPGEKLDDSDDHRIPEAYFRATGGPDASGYTYTDSDGGGCTYGWLGIEATGIVLELDGDEGLAVLPIDFAFPFYGQTYTQLLVDSNGALLLEAEASDWGNLPLGAEGPSPRLAPFWDDLVLDSVRYQVLGLFPRRVLVVTYQAHHPTEGQLHFQTILGEDGRITFQYRALPGALSDGVSATVGIQGPETGLGYLFNGYPESNLLHDGLAVCFHPPDGIYLSPGFQRGYARAGDEVRYSVTAINQTGAAGEFDFAVGSRWPARVVPERAYLESGERLDLEIAVQVPTGMPGERVEVVVEMAGGGADLPTEHTVAELEVLRASGGYGYMGASATDEAAVFDLQTRLLVDHFSILPEGNYPYDATMKPDGTEVWIPGASGDGVVVIDTAANQISHRVNVGEYPIGVAFRKDSAYAFVSNRDTEDVTIVDTSSYTVVDTIPIPTMYLGAGNLTLNPVSGDIYVVDWYGDRFWVLDTETFTVKQEVPLGSSLWQLVVNPLGDRLYITDRGQDVVHVLDTATLTEITAVSVGDDPWGIDITLDGALIYVTNEDSHNVTAIDATSNSVITTIALPHGSDADPRDIDFDPSGAYAYIPSGDVTGDDYVYVIETSTHSLAGMVNVAPTSNPNVVAVVGGLAADKEATPNPVVLGDPLTYTIAFTYTGLVSATNVLVTDTLPTGTAYLESSGGLTSTYIITDHLVVWDLGDVGPSASGELVALVQPVDWGLAGEVITNEAFLDFTSFQNFSVTVTATSTVLSPSLSIRFLDGSEPPDPLLRCEGEGDTVLQAVTNRPGPLTYTWDLGDGTVVNTPVITHGWTYGDYTVVLTTANAYSWVETDTLSVEVGHEPAAAFLSNSPVVFGENAVFTDVTAYGSTAWLWDFGDGVGTSDQANPVYNYSSAGWYTVTLTVTNRCGVDTYSDLFEVWETPAYNYLYLPIVVGGSP